MYLFDDDLNSFFLLMDDDEPAPKRKGKRGKEVVVTQAELDRARRGVEEFVGDPEVQRLLSAFDGLWEDEDEEADEWAIRLVNNYVSWVFLGVSGLPRRPFSLFVTAADNALQRRPEFLRGEGNGKAEIDGGGGRAGHQAQGRRARQRGHHLCAGGVYQSAFYRWIGDPKNKLQRALSEGLKKEESQFKHTPLTTIRSAALARNQYWTAAARVSSLDASPLVMPAFHDVLGDVMAHGHTRYWLHGARGSTKSSLISVAIVLLDAAPVVCAHMAGPI